jgi:hypothetical protein
MLESILLSAFPLATFIAGIFLGLKLAPQPQQSQPTIIVTESKPDNEWPTSIDTNNQ